MTTEELYVTIYGDGALLDASFDPDVEGDGQGDWCKVLYTLPGNAADDAVNYCRDGNTRPGYRDGYEALGALERAALSSELLECTVDWDSDGPGPEHCYLCGERH